MHRVCVLCMYWPSNFHILFCYPQEAECGCFNLLSKCLLVLQIDDLTISLDFYPDPIFPLSV